MMLSTFPKHLKIATLFGTLKDRCNLKTKEGTLFCDPETILVSLLSQFLNFTYTLVKPEDQSIGQPLEGGNWTGIIGMLQHGECDLSFYPTMLYEERSRAVDFSYPYVFSRVTFLTKKPRPLAKNFAIIYPFSYSLWITFAIFIFSFSLFFCAMNTEGRQYVRTLFSTIGGVVGQPLFPVKLTSWKRKFSFIGWLIGNSFLLYAYKALLLSFLLFAPMKGISTIAELSSAVADGSVKCITPKGSSITNALLESSDESIRIIGQSAKENSDQFTSKYDDLMNSTENFAIVDAVAALKNLSSHNFLSEETFFSSMIAVPYRKDFCCKKVLNKILKRIFETGLFGKILHDFFTRYLIQDGLAYKESENEHILTLQDIQGAVAILIFGHALALLVFIIEKCVCFKISKL